MINARDASGAPEKTELTFAPGFNFSRKKIWLVAGISAAVVTPCFWHRRIEAGDLASHTYNAWLAQLIASGTAPGLYLAHQWNNVLLDLALTRMGSAVGLAAAEKIVLPICVLLFFWGTFVFITAATGRQPWFLAPAIAMIAYGWTFQMGFLNFYLSLALAFISIALLWRKWPRRRLPVVTIAGLILAGLVLLAHPASLLWLAGTAAYLILAGRLPARRRWLLFAAGLVAILAIHFYIAHHYRTYDPVLGHAYLFSGPDQLVVYGHRYRILAAAMLLIATGIMLGSFTEWAEAGFWSKIRTPLELWLLAIFGVAMVWGDIVIPRYATGFTFLPQRLSTITGVLGMCLLGCVRPRKWHLAVFLGCAAVFFSWIYQDTGRLNGMEQQAETMVSTLPYWSRVVATLCPPFGWRIGPQHIVDRACIGKCFVYSNYEPSTRQFRVRVAPEGSPLVTSSPAAALAMSEGKYTVQPYDLPMAQIYQCDTKDLGRLCMRNLAAGEINGRIGNCPPD